MNIAFSSASIPDAIATPIEKCKGEVLKFIGDGMLAIFPAEDDDDFSASSVHALEAATEGLARLLRDEMLAQTLGANGHSRAVANFSWQKVAEATCALHARLGA